MATTPTIRCPKCEHPIDSHLSPENASGHMDGNQNRLCMAAGVCRCRMTPNLIAVAHLFGDLTPAPATAGVKRDPKTGDWS